MTRLTKRATVYLEPELHRALRLKSVETARSVSELLNDAIRAELAKDAEDLAAFEARKNEAMIGFEDFLKELKRRGKGRGLTLNCTPDLHINDHQEADKNLRGDAMERTRARSPVWKRKMTRRKKKLTAAQKAYKKLMHEKYEWIFINGKQKRVKRAPTIEGLPVDEFIRRNADPIWLLENEMYEELHEGQETQELLDP